MKAVEDSNEFDAWRSKEESFETWNSWEQPLHALQPQLLKLEEVFDETVKPGTTIQEELKSAILLRCVGSQFKNYLELDNWRQCSILNFEGTSRNGIDLSRSGLRPWWLVAVQTIKGPLQMDVSRVQNAKGKGKKVKMPRAKERRQKEIRKERKVITRAKVKAQTKKAKVWQHVTLVESQDILLKIVGGTVFDR